MSAEVAKVSPTAVAGRRTPLSLTQKTDTKANKVHIPEKEVTNGSTSSKIESTPNVESKKEKKVETQDPIESKPTVVDDKKKETAHTSKKETAHTSKKEERKQENGTDTAKQDSKTNGHKLEKDAKSDSTIENKGNDLETSKNKIIKNKDDKSALPKKEKDNEEKANDKSSKKEEKQKHERKTKKDITKDKSIEEKNEKQNVPEITDKDLAKIDETTEPITTARTTTTVTQTSSKTVTETVHNISTDEDEMECLIVEPEPEISENKQATPGKVLRLKNRPAPYQGKSSSQTSPEKPHRKILHAVTPNDRKTDFTGGPNTPSTDQIYNTSLRSISGRRSFRPLPEISYRSYNRESYRKVNTELDVSSSSLNVTVGSEIQNDSMFGLGFLGRSRKRERISVDASDNQQEFDISPKSPKRPRISLLDMVKTPITLLRSHFARTTIQSSTPKAKNTKTDDDGVENVSVIDAAESEYQDDILSVEEAESVKEDKFIDESIAALKDKKEDDNLKEKEKALDEDPLVQQPTEADDNVNKRKMCSIM